MEEKSETSVRPDEQVEALPETEADEDGLSPEAEAASETSVSPDEQVETSPFVVSAGTGISPMPTAPALAPRRYIVPPRRSNVPWVLAVILALAVGLAVGGLVVRQRYKARQVVVAVNGAPINQTDFYRRLESQSGDIVIRKMVGEELYLQFARKLGKVPDDATVEAKLKDLLTQPDFQKGLAISHLSLDDVRHQLRSQLARQAVLTKDVPVTEAEARHFYEVNVDPHNVKALFYMPDTSQIAVIITPTLEQAEKAYAALRNGVPFESAVAIYSQDATRITGGQLPPILRGRTTSKNFPQLEQAIFALKIGGQVGPMQVGHDWWIIRCLDKRAATKQTYAQVKEQCQLGAALSKLSPKDQGKIETTFADFQKHATIQAFWSRYANAVDLK